MGSSSYAGESVQEVSLAQLIASPQAYDGKRVQVSGYFHTGFEVVGLYQQREEHWQWPSSMKKAMWLQFGEIDAQPGDFNDSYVSVEGTFDASDHGHLGAWPGTIANITHIEARKETR